MAKAVKKAEAISEREMVEAIELVSKEKNIDKEILFKAIEASLSTRPRSCGSRYALMSVVSAQMSSHLHISARDSTYASEARPDDGYTPPPLPAYAERTCRRCRGHSFE